MKNNTDNFIPISDLNHDFSEEAQIADEIASDERMEEITAHLFAKNRLAYKKPPK